MHHSTFRSNGVRYRIEVGTGSEFETEITSIVDFLELRAHVKKRFLRSNLPRTRLLAVAYSGNQIVAVCALKGTNTTYSRAISSKSGFFLSDDAAELGYAATDEAHRRRGLGGHLNSEILTRAPKALYATCRVGNASEERILTASGFRPVGSPWQADHTMIGVWVRDTGLRATKNWGTVVRSRGA